MPAHVLHWIGRSGDVPSARPKQTSAVATSASTDISTGRETAAAPAGSEGLAADVVWKACSAECSWAE